MPLQTLTLKLDGITAGDYLTWCRDPDPAALDFALRSTALDADPLGDTIAAVLDWAQSPPAPHAAATAAGLPLSPDVRIQPAVVDDPEVLPLSTIAAALTTPRIHRRSAANRATRIREIAHAMISWLAPWRPVSTGSEGPQTAC
jgi:hypothetical protein